MSRSGDGRTDAGRDLELQGKIVIDIKGDSVDARQTPPQPNQQHESESQEVGFSTISERHDGLESNAAVRSEVRRAANKGDWRTAKRIYENHKLSFDAWITAERQTVLHIAALAGQTQFVRELMKEMSDHGLRLRDSGGNTAFFFAVVSGKRALVGAMLQRNEDLAMLKNNRHQLPIYTATSLGRRDIVNYLYRACKHRLEDSDCADLLVPLIDADIYDTALDLVKGDWFATCREGYKVEALKALARKPHLSASISSKVLSSGALRRCLINPYGNFAPKQVQKIILQEKAWELAEYICEKVASDDNEITHMERELWRPIFVATENGNVGFLQILIKHLPDAVFKRNKYRQTIFHVAVCFRRAEVFDLLSEIGSVKYLIARYKDVHGNNMLHLAGMNPLSDYLDDVPGAALQLQRELLWFERVKKLVGPVLAEDKNGHDRSPIFVFKNYHKSLIEKGEEWMKKTADSCTIVAALVATVVFAAAFTAPGGNDQTTGFPMFLNKASFKIFIVSDSISLIIALSSLLTFMSIQTSTYSLKDFVWSLPTKLLIGYSTLFVSIATMLVAFVTVLFVYFTQHQLLSVALPLALVAVFPIVLFTVLHYRLLNGVIMFWRALENIHH